MASLFYGSLRLVVVLRYRIIISSATNPSYRVGQDLANPTPLFTTRGRSWTGPAGFSSERWNLWKCRFAAVERSDAALETKALAQTAVRSMVLVDGMTVP